MDSVCVPSTPKAYTHTHSFLSNERVGVWPKCVPQQADHNRSLANTHPQVPDLPYSHHWLTRQSDCPQCQRQPLPVTLLCQQQEHSDSTYCPSRVLWQSCCTTAMLPILARSDGCCVLYAPSRQASSVVCNSCICGMKEMPPLLIVFHQG